VSESPLLSQLQKSELGKLRELASLFLHDKVVVGAGDFELDAFMRVTIAAQASLLVLNLGLDWYDGWSEVIVYPDAFIVSRPELDEAGVVHENSRGLSGEAWSRGPVILSWADIDPSIQHHSGSNVVLHEFAHKLDFLDGSANGIPPLHPGNQQQEWAKDFSRAYDDLSHHSFSHSGGIDRYATTNPAEFFAVMTELFFEDPMRLQQHYPTIYNELQRFYRQDPIRRLI
ncbi:MAG: zinc-dependent peptidase, partial [Chromatiales bacterium]|nr:zinc-dependent peptidase [Chromatiales bacterium]